MNDQLKHDTAVAAAHAAADHFPGCLLPAEREAAVDGCARVVRAALDAYDHFRPADWPPAARPGCGDETAAGDPEPL